MRINKDLRSRCIENKYFIVALNEKSKTFSGMVKLNETGAMIFEMLKKDKSVAEIAQRLASVYGISQEKAEKDVNETVLLFEKAGFFE